MPPFLGESYIHRLDPFAVEVTEGLGVRWYGLSYLAGFVIAWLLLRWLSRKRRCALSPAEVPDFLFYLVAGVFLGGRLGYCIFYEPQLLWDPPVIGIIQIWRGGMASHGGFIGVVIATILFARKRSLSTMELLDVEALVGTPGLGLGRLANFVNAELWGKALPASLQADPPWWSVKYPQEILEAGFSRADQVAALRPLVPDGAPFPQNLLDAVQSGDEAVTEALRPLLTAYYPSQIFQAITDGPILFLLMAGLWFLLPRRKPGYVAGGFLISYGLLRIATEVFRQPDTGVSLLPTPLGSLQRGQVLSTLTVIVGVTLVIAAARMARSGGRKEA